MGAEAIADLSVGSAVRTTSRATTIERPRLAEKRKDIASTIPGHSGSVEQVGELDFVFYLLPSICGDSDLELDVPLRQYQMPLYAMR